MSRESVKVDKLARKVEEKLGASELINLQLSSTGTASANLDATGGANDQVTWTVTLINDFNLRLFGMENVSVYESSVASANKIPSGSAVDAADYQIVIWTDWGQSDNNNIKLIVFVRNLSAGAKTVVLRVNYRFLVEGSDV